jgi:methionyl-tRNA formyltransferase
VFQPQKLDHDAIERLRAARADALIVAAYGLILPRVALEVAPHGAINIHASLLPRWRGAAPIQRALLAGDAETGISIMQMDAGLDTGPVYAQRRVPIRSQDDAGTLHERLAELGAEALLAVLDDIAAGRARATPQPAEGATYARKLDKAETFLDWTRPAQELERAVRAFCPAAARLQGATVKIWRAALASGAAAPGTVLDARGTLRVACGTGALSIEELQPAGKRRMAVAEFLRGHPLDAGARFE